MASMTDGPAPSGEAGTILVAEDEVLVRHDMSEYLRAHGFNVIEANGAAEAIRVLKDSLSVSAVFTDIRMPGTVDGIGLARYVRKHRPIITSGHIQAQELPEDLGPLIDKPYDRAQVTRAIVEALSKKQDGPPG